MEINIRIKNVMKFTSLVFLLLPVSNLVFSKTFCAEENTDKPYWLYVHASEGVLLWDRKPVRYAGYTPAQKLVKIPFSAKIRIRENSYYRDENGIDQFAYFVSYYTKSGRFDGWCKGLYLKHRPAKKNIPKPTAKNLLE